MHAENQLSFTKNILLYIQKDHTVQAELDYLFTHFCGEVVAELNGTLTGKRIFACGDLSSIEDLETEIQIINGFTSNYTRLNTTVVELGQVPIAIENAGVYYRQLFLKDNYFENIKTAHDFQELTESNKTSKALRKGIYLTEVKKEEETYHFHLLRCSSNLTGPTANFKTTDHEIMHALNHAVTYDFELPTKLNHVLAQIYENKKKDEGKEVKAKIKAHSDKTKDMPAEGLIAFCTFYDTINFNQLQRSKTDPFDWCYKKSSGLTRLLFKLKPTVNDPTLTKEFSVTLYPNSAFLIPLSTNRLYTHEIRPSVLNIDKIPVRMGYVARCSNLEAVHQNNQTYIKENGELIQLTPMTSNSMDDLRDSYYEENNTINKVDYGKVHFSMNAGDYEKPIY